MHKRKPLSFRSCKGCGKSNRKENLIRISHNGRFFEVNGSGGRGFYVCATKNDCMERALKKKVLAKHLRLESMEIPVGQIEALKKAVQGAIDNRVHFVKSEKE